MKRIYKAVVEFDTSGPFFTESTFLFEQKSQLDWFMARAKEKNYRIKMHSVDHIFSPVEALEEIENEIRHW